MASFNFNNMGNQNQPLHPLFASLGNANGAAGLSNNPNFLNKLASVMSRTSPATNSGTTVTASSTSSKRERQCTPEPPPAPKFSSLRSPKMKTHQGHAPMDLENEFESETIAPSLSITNRLPNAATAINTAPKGLNTNPLQLHDPMFLNSLLSAQTIDPSAAAAAAAAVGYMFFPTPSPSVRASSGQNVGHANASLLLDQTAMMAAAMQQMQNYAGYTLASENTLGVMDGTAATTSGATPKEVIKTKNCVLFPPNPNAPPPTIRDRPAGCRTVFVGGLPENITEEIIREIFESCGEIITLRMSKKNFCHIRYRQETSIDRAIYLSGYRVRIANGNETASFGRLHVDYAQARDDQYDFECKQRQLQREQRHRELMSLDHIRSQSPPPIVHYTDHEASLVSESLRSNDTFLKAVQTISVWLERGDCTKRNANIFYSMIQSTHAHVRRLHTDKQQHEEELRKARENYRKQMLTMSTQFTQIEKVFNAASHKKVWDHFTKAQRKNIDQWKKLATELRSVQIDDDEMEMSDDDRMEQPNNHTSSKRSRYDADGLKEENDSLRCQLEAMRNELSMERTDTKYDTDFREKQIKVLQETIRNMQTQLMQTKLREQKDSKAIDQLEHRLKEAGVKQLLLKTKIKETSAKLKDKEVPSSVTSETSELIEDYEESGAQITTSDIKPVKDETEIIDIDLDKSDDEVKIIDDNEECSVEMKKKIESITTKEPIGIVAQEHIKESEDHKDEIEKEMATMTTMTFSLNEAKLIALTATFLVVHPFGATNDEICSYLNQTMQTSDAIEPTQLFNILKKYENLFASSSQRTLTLPANNDDDNNKNCWLFCGYAPKSSTNINEL